MDEKNTKVARLYVSNDFDFVLAVLYIHYMDICMTCCDEFVSLPNVCAFLIPIVLVPPK